MWVHMCEVHTLMKARGQPMCVTPKEPSTLSFEATSLIARTRVVSAGQKIPTIFRSPSHQSLDYNHVTSHPASLKGSSY